MYITTTHLNLDFVITLDNFDAQLNLNFIILDLD